MSESPASRIFGSLYLVLAGNVFADLDDAVDAELHSLIKCVPKIIAENHLDVRPEDIDSFIREETSSNSLE